MRDKHATQMAQAARRTLATSPALVSQIQLDAAERSASPAAHTTLTAASLADEINAIRGRVHAVVMLPLIESCYLTAHTMDFYE